MGTSEGNQLQKAIAAAGGPGSDFVAVIPNPKLKLLEQVREVLRLRHYSIRTEQSYCDWIRRYVKFHQMHSREELLPGEAKIELFLSDLAVNGQVAASTQNQAFNALLFLYREVLHKPFENIQAVRASRPVRVPVVLTEEEVSKVIVAMSGTPQLVVKLLYGSGLILLEALRLRVQDVDFAMKQLKTKRRDAKKRREAQRRKPGAEPVWSSLRISPARTPALPVGTGANTFLLLESAGIRAHFRGQNSSPPRSYGFAGSPRPTIQAACSASERMRM